MSQADTTEKGGLAPGEREASVVGKHRRSGTELIGNIPWGTHFCQFYQTKQDLIDILVPYFKAGLEDNEFCVWVTGESLDEQGAAAALSEAVPGLDRYLESGQIEIIPHDQWYLLGGSFDSDRVLAGWVDRLDGALSRGFDGLRLTGDTFWLERSDWEHFTDYEAAINSMIGKYRMIAICTYSIDRCGASEVADVVTNHQFALMKRAGQWSVIESSDYRQARLGLQETNAALNRAQAVSHTGSWRLDIRRNELFWSDETYRIFGKSRGAMLTYESFLACVHPDDRDYVDECWRTGTHGEPYDIEHRIVVDNAVKWVRETAELEFGGDGTLLGGFGTVQDVSDRKRAEEDLAAARADAERHAAELQSFISSAADGFALFDTEGHIRWMNDAALELLGVESVYPYDDWLRDYVRFTAEGEPLPDDQSAVARALAGETVQGMREVVETPGNKRIVISVSASPIRDLGGEAFGATAVFRDVRETVEFERRQEELYQREHHIAELLQQALIAPGYSYEAPDYEVAVKYRPALTEADVGGDFYDLFRLPDGRVGVMIGDVAGKGLLAAIRVSAARYSVRSYALVDPSPARSLRLANEALARDETEGLGMLTVFFAVLNAAGGMIHYSNGGHEPAVLLTRDGAIHDLEAGGGPLGVLDEMEYVEAEVAMRPGDTIVMVTDGITEARSADQRFFGREGIGGYLASAQAGSCEVIAEGLMSAAVEHAGGRLQDDAAIVVLQLRGQPAETAAGSAPEKT